MTVEVLNPVHSISSITQGASYKAVENIEERLALLICTIASLMMDHLEQAEKEHLDHQRKQLNRNLSTYNTYTKLALSAGKVLLSASDSALQIVPTKLTDIARTVFGVDSRIFQSIAAHTQDFATMGPLCHKICVFGQNSVDQVSGLHENNLRSEQIQADTHEKMAKTNYDRAVRKHQEFQSQVEQALKQFAEANQRDHSTRGQIISR